MKMTKFFAAMFAVAALTFTACEPKNDGPVIGDPTDSTVDLDIPQVTPPAAAAARHSPHADVPRDNAHHF